MTTVAIVPMPTRTGGRAYQAVAGRRMAAGDTAGQALDALTEQFPEVESESFLVVKRFPPDKLFTEQQQLRLAELMGRWRESRDSGGPWSAEEQSELDSLVDAELAASGERAASVAQGLGR